MITPENYFVTEDYVELEEEVKALRGALEDMVDLSPEEKNEMIKTYKDYHRYRIGANRIVTTWGERIAVLKDENKALNEQYKNEQDDRKARAIAKKVEDNLRTIETWEGIYAQLDDERCSLEEKVKEISSRIEAASRDAGAWDDMVAKEPKNTVPKR